MKKIIQYCSILFLLGMITTTAQISISTGGAANVLPNVPTTNTNVDIGTTNPTAKLEVVGTLRLRKATLRVVCQTVQFFLLGEKEMINV